jgi:hypothetical protein
MVWLLSGTPSLLSEILPHSLILSGRRWDSTLIRPQPSISLLGLQPWGPMPNHQAVGAGTTFCLVPAFWPQAVNPWLPTAVARVRSCGIYGGQNDTGAGFLWVPPFPQPIIPPIAPHSSSSSIIRGEYSRLSNGQCAKLTLSHPT